MKLALIAAVADNGVIGRENQLPWRLPADLRHFKDLTMGKPLIMGRKTFESLGKPLPGRPHIIVTRAQDFSYPGCYIVHDLDAALQCASDLLAEGLDSEAMVIGGAEIYRLMLPRIQRMYLTEVHCQVGGDAFFPTFDRSQWQEVARQDCTAADLSYSFVVYERL